MRIEVEGKVIEKKQVSISEYSAGDYFPKEALTECLPFSIIADSPCEIISMPKRCLRAMGWAPPNQCFKGEEHYKSELARQTQWQGYKEEYLTQNLNFK